jgi:hypothetical protein
MRSNFEERWRLYRGSRRAILALIKKAEREKLAQRPYIYKFPIQYQEKNLVQQSFFMLYLIWLPR